jgi:uncharacterized protein YhdP
MATALGLIVLIALFILIIKIIVSRINRPKQKMKEISNVKYYFLANKKVS